MGKRKQRRKSASDNAYQLDKQRPTKRPALSPPSNNQAENPEPRPRVTKPKVLPTTIPGHYLPSQRASPSSDEHKLEVKGGNEKGEKGRGNSKKRKAETETEDNTDDILPGGSKRPMASADNNTGFQLVNPPKIDKMPSGCFACPMEGQDGCDNKGGKGFETEWGTSRHIGIKHNRDQFAAPRALYSQIQQMPSGKFKCPYDGCCNNQGQGFASRTVVRKHLKGHYSDVMRYRCQYKGQGRCNNNKGRGWIILSDLFKHIREAHHKDDQQLYYCSQVGDDNCNNNTRRGWTNLGDFAKHIQKVHYKDDQQLYYYSQVGDDNCSNNTGRGWTILGDFVKHIREVHYKLGHCHCPQIGQDGCDNNRGKGWSSAVRLKLHIRVIHQGLLWKCLCESCDNNGGRGFPSPTSLLVHQESRHFYNPETRLFDTIERSTPPPKSTFLPLGIRLAVSDCMFKEWPGRENRERRAKEIQELKAILISKYEYPHGFRDELGTGYCPVYTRANNALTHDGKNHDFIVASLDGCTMIYFHPDEKKIRYEDIANLIITSVFKNRFLGRRPKIVLILSRESRNGKTKEDFVFIIIVGRNVEDTMNEVPIWREVRQQLQLSQERVNEINESLRTGQPLEIRYRNRPDSIREHPKHRATRNRILKRCPQDTNSVPWIRTPNYDWEANLPRRYHLFDVILRQEKYRTIPREMVFRNGIVFPFSERSWGIPDDYDNADYQAIIENHAQIMYTRCNRRFRDQTPHIEALILEDFINYLDCIQEVSPGFWVARSPDGLEMMPYSIIFAASFGKRIHGQAMTTRFDPDDPYPTNVDIPATRSNIERTSWGWNQGWLSISPEEELKRAAIQHLDDLPPDEEMKRFYELPDRKDLRGRDDGQKIISKWNYWTNWRAEPWGCKGMSKQRKDLKNTDEEIDDEGMDDEGMDDEGMYEGMHEGMDDELTGAIKALCEQQAPDILIALENEDEEVDEIPAHMVPAAFRLQAPAPAPADEDENEGIEDAIIRNRDAERRRQRNMRSGGESSGMGKGKGRA